MKIVDHFNQTAGGFGDVVEVGGAVDEGVGCVAGTFEGDLDLLVFDAEVGECAVQVVSLQQMVDDGEFVGVAGGWA